jgi:hypothetical protein
MAGYLSLARVLALVGGLALVAAFFMPWFSSSGLLLSGQFLHTFLGGASAAELRRFVPAGSPAEVQALRALVDLFPECGALAAAASLVGGLVPAGRGLANVVLGLSGLVPLAGWGAGITRLPAGANAEIGLWLIAVGALAVLAGLACELVMFRQASG